MDLPHANEEFDERLRPSLADSEEILLCSDFDGTLVAFTELPGETRLPSETENLLLQLTENERIHLAVISGRDFDELTSLLALDNLTLAGNHGLKIRFADGSIHRHQLSAEIEDNINQLERQLKETFSQEEGIVIENKKFGLAFHYRQFGGDEGKLKKRFLEVWSNFDCPGLEVLEGAKLVEVRPGSWDKGDAIRLLQEKWRDVPVIYIGDDTTDEDAFEVLREQENGFPVLVECAEGKTSLAEYRLKNPVEVKNFLKKVLKIFDCQAGN